MPLVPMNSQQLEEMVKAVTQAGFRITSVSLDDENEVDEEEIPRHLENREID
jgi:hypothetical protein